MIKTRIANKFDIKEVLALQEKYLYKNLTEQERDSGFVTTPFTIPQIEEIIAQDGLFIAEHETSIIAYAFAGSWEYFKQWDIFTFMISRFPKLSFNEKEITTKNSFQYGPVCIDKNYRGQGVLNLIFEEMRIELFKKYPVSITFINKINIVSEKAHTKKLGWQIIEEFKFNNNTYITLAFDMKTSVINSSN